MKKPTRNKKLIFLSIVIFVVLSIATTAFLANRAASEKTYPLGSQLEYIGQTGYGCWLVCDSNPNAVYYYGTDMSVDQVAAYFRNSTLDQTPRTFDEVTDFSLKTKNGEDILVYYYTDKSKITKDNSLKSTGHSHILSIPSFDYAIAQRSL